LESQCVAISRRLGLFLLTSRAPDTLGPIFKSSWLRAETRTNGHLPCIRASAVSNSCKDTSRTSKKTPGPRPRALSTSIARTRVLIENNSPLLAKIPDSGRHARGFTAQWIATTFSPEVETMHEWSTRHSSRRERLDTQICTIGQVLTNLVVSSFIIYIPSFEFISTISAHLWKTR
jgi:hypothetical protein